MRAISLHQPYASLVILGFKPTETRHWYTDYRGPLAIHAAKKFDAPRAKPSFIWAIKECGLRWTDLTAFPRGAIVGTVDLVDCVEMTEANIALVGKIDKEFGLYKPGRFMWKLKNVRRLENPIDCVGRQSFFNVDLGGEAER